MIRIVWLKHRISIIIIITLLSCSGRQGSDTVALKEIDVESSVGGGRVVPLSEVATDISYIKLETTDSSLIEFNEVVFIENERIYVRSGVKRHLTVFDMNGRFLFRFDKKGRGAEEYSRVQWVDIEPGTGNILVSDYTNLKLYDRDGKFLKKIEFPKMDRIYFTDAKFLSKDTLISAAYNASPDSKSFVIFNEESKILKVLPMPVLPELVSKVNFATSNANAYSVSGKSKIIEGKNRSTIFYLESDTIFSLDKKLNYNPVYTIKFGRYLNRMASRKDVSRVSGKHISVSTVTMNQSAFETEDYLCISYNLRDYAHEKYLLKLYFSKKDVYLSECISLYNKRDETFTFLNHPQKGNPGFKEDFLDGPPFFPLAVTSDNRVVSLYSAEQIIDYCSKNSVTKRFSEIRSALKEGDNPVVAIAKLKD